MVCRLASGHDLGQGDIMRRALRWVVVATGLSLALVMVSAVTLAIEHRRPASALTADLKGADWAAQSADFDGRLRKQFPNGGSEREVISELEREGFKPDWPSVYNEHQAVRREDSIVCGVGVYAMWKVDPVGKINSIRGVYQEEGCF